MTTKAHWEAVYREKAPDEVSWYRPHLEKSVQLIQQAAPDRSAPIIDVGGGESTLVDDLLALGYRKISVLDISGEAIQTTRQRLGTAARTVKWLVDDITQANLPEHHYVVWHDRAVFHFLIEPEQQAAYVQQVLHSLTTDGHLVMAVFGPEGPKQCSGLEVVRHDIERLCEHLGPHFELISHRIDEHRTPGGNAQQFLYAHFRLKGSESRQAHSSPPP
ncbi:class I SAM-dependent methyltransferase [Vreelandella rituensis]|uniref:Class I SAM-dependent methyltransferase n=1 Tax=Vreelandella rituensis TaxID=2282306 RepID=A0A368U8L0_9GAMM|nr:class I SAM-dependent methyltransferase [Halomonas rituensis]RCV93241.1 class I SAM-dependent methyltransferase [Halomonas rituensis]